MPNRPLTVRQAADSAARHPSTIRRWIKVGKLRAAKVGGRYQVDAAELDTLLEADVLPMPPEWRTTATGAPIPNVVAALRRSRAERSRELARAVRDAGSAR